MRPIEITREVQIALYRWTTDVRRARDDYDHFPTRACRAEGCDDLHDNDALLCEEHRRLLAERQTRRTKRKKAA